MIDVSEIGLIHANYLSGQSSGENLSVENSIRVIRDLGMNCNRFKPSIEEKLHSKVGRLALGSEVFFGGASQFFKSWIAQQSALQIHNSFPILSHGEIRYLQTAKIPIIRVVHNYRIQCLKGTHFRLGQKCYACNLSNQSIPGIFHGCYRNSRIQSFIARNHQIEMQFLFKRENVYWVALSSFVRDYLLDLGVANKDIFLVPEFVEASASIVTKSTTDFFFCGELSDHKGIKLLLNIWRLNLDLPKLHIVGDGVLSSLVLSAAQTDKRIVYYGRLSKTQIDSVASTCRFAIVPSIWDEPFGRVAIEALSRGQFVVASKVGSLSNILQDTDATLCLPNEKDLLAAIRKALDIGRNLSSVKNMETWKNKFSPMVVRQSWQEVYSRVGQS